MDTKILVLIPCYNEEENIVSTVERLKSTCPQVDFLVINDCSTDHSADILHAHHYPFLDLPVNLGIGGGVQCGYQYAVHNGYDVTIQMDGDGQHDPAYLMEVVQPVLDGTYDMCIGSRFIKKEGFQTSEAPVIMRERQGGVSSIHSFKSAYYMIKVSLALIIDRFSIHKVKGGKA